MIGAAVMAIVYAHLTGAIALLLAGALMGFFVNGMLGGYGAVISELYPTTARATAQNGLFKLGRAVGGFGPVAVAAIAKSLGLLALLAVLYLIDLAVLH
jgi:hypothetical protein